LASAWYGTKDGVIELFLLNNRRIWTMKQNVSHVTNHDFESIYKGLNYHLARFVETFEVIHQGLASCGEKLLECGSGEEQASFAAPCRTQQKLLKSSSLVGGCCSNCVTILIRVQYPVGSKY
jgi:hypothetical protein